VDEDPWRIQVRVPHEIDIVDVGTLKQGALPGTDMRGQKEHARRTSFPGKSCPPMLQLLGDDRGVLVSKVGFPFGNVSDGPLRALPLDDRIHRGESPVGREDPGARHPGLKPLPISIQIWVHVHYYRLFIIIEQALLLNALKIKSLQDNGMEYNDWSWGQLDGDQPRRRRPEEDDE
jgi:hypothetical protein